MTIKQVKKAIIIGAGLGSRMYPFTKVESKLMIPIMNKPVIEFILEELKKSGIDDVIIISNHVTKIQQLLSKNYGLNELLKNLKKANSIRRLRHVECMDKFNLIQEEVPYGWLYEVLRTEGLIENEPFIVCFSDLIFKGREPASKQLIDLYYKKDKNIKANGRFLFKPNCFKLMKGENYKLGEDIADIDFFEKLETKKDLMKYTIKGKMLDIGDPFQHAKTETIMALRNPQFGKKYKEFLKTLVK